MKIKIIEHQVEITSDLRSHVEKRVGLALARYANSIDQVNVKFMKGRPNGDIDELVCLIELNLKKPLRVKAEHSDAFSAVDLAIERIVRRVSRTATILKPGDRTRP